MSIQRQAHWWQSGRSLLPAGLLFMNGKSIPIDPFKKLTAVQSPIVMAAVINSVLAVDKAGLPCPDWGSMCDDKMAVKLFKGQLAVGNSATTIDYWALAKRVTDTSPTRYQRVTAPPHPN